MIDIKSLELIQDVCDFFDIEIVAIDFLVGHDLGLDITNKGGKALIGVLLERSRGVLIEGNSMFGPGSCSTIRRLGY